MEAGEDGGFVRVMARKPTITGVLGIQAVGRHVSELSAEFATALEMGAVLEDIGGHDPRPSDARAKPSTKPRCGRWGTRSTSRNSSPRA